MRWHIIRTLLAKEARRQLANRGGIALALVLLRRQIERGRKCSVLTSADLDDGRLPVVLAGASRRTARSRRVKNYGLFDASRASWPPALTFNVIAGAPGMTMWLGLYLSLPAIAMNLNRTAVGLARPSTSFLDAIRKDVDGVAEPRHDVGARGG